MAGPWEKYQAPTQSSQQPEGPWSKYAAPKQEEKVMPLESLARGAAQGASLGFVDEGVGATKAIGDDFKKLVTGEGSKPEVKRDQFGRITNLDEINQDATYTKHRDDYRAADEAAEKANPGYYAAGEVGGAIATSAIPIGSSATVAKAIQTGARAGAINAAGQSKAENAGDFVRDVAAGTAMGAVGGGIAKGGEKLIKGVRSGISNLSRKGADEALDTTVQTFAKESGSAPVDDPNVIKEAAESARARLKSFLNPEVDPSFEEFAEIARKNGIDPNVLPESVKFGPDSSASRAARNLAEGRFGEETLKRFNQTLDQVRDAYDRKIVNYSKGAPVDEITAGKVLRDAYDEGVTKFFDQMDFTHNNIIDQVPGFQLTEASLKKIDSALNGVEKFAKGRMLRGVTETQRGQGQQLMNAVEAIRAGNGSYKQTVEALRDIGEAAFQSKNSLSDVPVDTAKMRKLYNDLNEGLLDTVRSELGDDVADSLVANNKAMSEFFGEKSLISRVMGDKAIAPENAFKSLVLSGDSQKIAALKKIIPPEKWEYLKGAVLENLVKRDPESNFTFRQLHNSMRNKASTLSSIFEPQELMENAGLVRLGDRFGSPVLSTSGTGASLSFQDLGKSATNLSVDALAIRNANKAAEKATQAASAPAQPPMRDVSPTLKELPSKVAGLGFSSAIVGEKAPTQGKFTGESPILPSPQNRVNSEDLPSPQNDKGPQRWIRVGAEKLNQAGISPAEIEALRKTKAGQSLLIDASDASPDSVRMKSIIQKIRTASSQGGQ